MKNNSNSCFNCIAVENKIKVGVVYNPFLEEMFYSVVGQGAFLNENRIRVKEVYD